MGIYGYCVLPPGQLLPAGLQGIEQARVEAIEVAGLTVWVSEIERPEAGVQQIQVHNAVVEKAVTETVTPVPLRFGQWSAEMEPFSAALEARAAWYRERLAAFAGAMEFGLRILRPDQPAPAQLVRVPPAETGTAYMQALRARTAAARSQREAAAEIRTRVTEALRAVTREERIDEATTPHGVVSMAHLVGRAQFEAYRAAVQELRAEQPALRFLLSGPWAPYTFAA